MSATATKTPNYTPEMTEEIVKAYKASPTPETIAELAAKFSRTVVSIRMKLVREKVYQKAEYKGKTGETPVDKEKLADEICAFLNPAVDENSVSSLAKANKKVLKALLKALTEADEFKKAAMEPFEQVEGESDNAS